MAATATKPTKLAKFSGHVFLYTAFIFAPLALLAGAYVEAHPEVLTEGVTLGVPGWVGTATQAASFGLPGPIDVSFPPWTSQAIALAPLAFGALAGLAFLLFAQQMIAGGRR